MAQTIIGDRIYNYWYSSTLLQDISTKGFSAEIIFYSRVSKLFPNKESVICEGISITSGSFTSSSQMFCNKVKCGSRISGRIKMESDSILLFKINSGVEALIDRKINTPCSRNYEDIIQYLHREVRYEIKYYGYYFVATLIEG